MQPLLWMESKKKLNKPKDTTRCAISAGLKKVSPWVMTALGGATVSDLFTAWQSNYVELLSFYNGTKGFSQLNLETQFFAISTSLLVLSIIAYFIGFGLYKHWNCTSVRGGRAA